MSTAWHDSIYSLLEYKLLTSCPHPHAAPVKSRLCCRCSHGSILDRQQLPPKSSLSYSHHASFYLRASEKSGIPSVATKKLLKADENSTENGFSVSIKLPHSPHGQPKKKKQQPYFLEDNHERLVLSTPVCKPAVQPNPFTAIPSKS